MKVNPSIGVKEALTGNLEINFYVIAKHSPRFKRVTINVEGISPEEAECRVKKYAENGRLIDVINKGQCLCETRISPQNPFAEQLKCLSDLTIDDKKVTQVTLMTEMEYKDFTASSLVMVKETVLVLQKQKEAKKSEVTAETPVSKATASKKREVTVTAFTILSKTQTSFHKMIMSILETMQTIRKAAEERTKEKEKVREEKRYLRRKEDVEEDKLNKAILAQAMNTQMLKQTVAKIN